MSRIISTKTEIEDLVRGTAFFGTGGGGQPEVGLESLTDELEAGREIRLVDAGEISEDSWGVSVFLMGTIAPMTPEKKEELESAGLKDIRFDSKEMLVEAVKELSLYTGKKIEFIIPAELGGANTAAPIAVASYLGLPALNGDFVGRAVPELTQCLPFLRGKEMWPLSSVDEYGNICLVKRGANASAIERIGKYISQISGKLTAQCGLLMRGAEARDVIIKDSVSESIEVGRIVREARKNGNGALAEIARSIKGWLLFRGKLVGKETDDREGYYWGKHTLAGIDEFAGHSFEVWFKNENHMSWLDQKLYVMSPDIMPVMNLDLMEPVTNTRLKLGDPVAVFGMKARMIYRSPKGLEVLGPSHFGFDVPYRPIEDIVR